MPGKCGTGRLIQRERDREKALLERVEQCKRLIHKSRNRTHDNEARQALVDFANENILPMTIRSEDLWASGSARDQKHQLICKMTLDEDVEVVRQILMENDTNEWFWRDLQGLNPYSIVELAMIFDASLEIVRVILEEKRLHQNVFGSREWNLDYHILISPFRCQYKWYVQYFDLLAMLGFQFSKVGIIPFRIPVKTTWKFTLRLFGVPASDLKAFSFDWEPRYQGFQTILVLASSKTIERLGRNSSLEMLTVDILRNVKSMLLEPQDHEELY